MMQSCASAAKLQGGGPILNRGSKTMCKVGLPPPRIVSCNSAPIGSKAAESHSCRSPHAAGRRARPAGASPVVTSRHNAMRSLRANATIMVLRVPPRASAVRARYHSAKALSFWCNRNPQASWIIPRRTRALPALARPCSRRFLPLSFGAPVKPAYRASALRSLRSREKTSCTSMSADSMPTPTTRAKRRTISWRSSPGAACSRSVRAVSISLICCLT